MPNSCTPCVLTYCIPMLTHYSYCKETVALRLDLLHCAQNSRPMKANKVYLPDSMIPLQTSTRGIQLRTNRRRTSRRYDTYKETPVIKQGSLGGWAAAANLAVEYRLHILCISFRICCCNILKGLFPNSQLCSDTVPV
jgi:hypothetical protein